MTSALALAAQGPQAASAPLSILIVTDAWAPQVNGVVRTLEMLGRELTALGHEVRYATPQGRFSIPLPTYPEIRLAIFPRRGLETIFRDFAPEAVHIATEGTMGMSARAICIKHAIAFTTSYHTRFPEYVRARFPFVPEGVVYRWLRWFHKPAASVMVATPSLKAELARHGFRNLRIWSRGVDTGTFRRIEEASLPFPKPIWLFVGRVAVEKNIEAFLELDLPGSKVIVGEGPARAALSRKYPEAHFLGPRTGEDLVRVYSASDVFVFPSKTDTFGLVMLEALACGLGVAAFPVPTARDVLSGAPGAALDADLRAACLKALELSHESRGTNASPRSFALEHSWGVCARQFLSNLAPETAE